MAEAYLINPVSRARPRTAQKRRKHMAKRRKLYGAALKAHQKKNGKSRPARKKRTFRRKARRPRSLGAAAAPRRKRHMVKYHTRKGGKVSGYKRSGANVTAHMSNRRRRRTRRNPFGMGQWGGATIEGLIAAGVLFGTLLAVGFVNKQIQRVNQLSTGWANLAARLGVALGGVLGAGYAVRQGWLSRANGQVAAAASFAPLTLGLVASFAPNIAGQISLADEDNGMGAELGMTPGNRLSDNTLDAELSAELGKQETEAGMY